MVPASILWLAQVPETGGYINLFKLVWILAWFLLFLTFGQWVSEDTRIIRAMSRNLWNGVILATGAAATAIWLLGPWENWGLFFAGWGVWLILTGGACAVYVVMRNRFVSAPNRVFTPEHIMRTLQGLVGKKSKGLDIVERVVITKADGKKIPPPTDPAEVKTYETAQSLLFDALWRRATDVIFAVNADNVRLIYKIDGFPTERTDILTAENVTGVVPYFKGIAGLNPEERRKPQSGRIKALHPTMERTKVELEIRSSGTREGERIDIRIITQESRMRLPDIGLAEQQLEQFEKIIQAPSGLVIISGPKGSGVTSTLYAAMRAHDAFMQNLHTMERQPLMELENITQNLFDPGKTDVTFARQLQTILRREPDVVMVSDCSDRETAHLAAKAAIDGKKIYVGMQATNSVDALKKFVNLVADSDVASAALSAISSQRLVRKLCVACRQAYKPNLAALRKMNIPADEKDVFYEARTEPMLDKKGRPVICTNCQGTGFYGRAGIFELLTLDENIREMIRNGQPAASIQKECRKAGMRFLDETGLLAVKKGTTSLKEVSRSLKTEEQTAAATAESDSSEM